MKSGMQMIFVLGFVLAMAAGLTFAQPAGSEAQPYINIADPTIQTLHNGDTVYVGVIGPGQTIPVRFDAITTSGGKFGVGGRWDYIEVTAVPQGWKGFNSQLHENPLQINVKADPLAPEGNYSVIATVVDENNGDLMGNLTLNLVFTVSHEVYSYTVYPEHITVGAYQPARFHININNMGNAPDTFVISTEGINTWTFKKTVYVPPKDSREVIYEVVGNDEETYSLTILIKSESTPLLQGSKNVTVDVKSDLRADYKSIVNGMLIFPITESTLYAFLGLLSNAI